MKDMWATLAKLRNSTCQEDHYAPATQNSFLAPNLNKAHFLYLNFRFVWFLQVAFLSLFPSSPHTTLHLITSTALMQISDNKTGSPLRSLLQETGFSVFVWIVYEYSVSTFEPGKPTCHVVQVLVKGSVYVNYNRKTVIIGTKIMNISI